MYQIWYQSKGSSLDYVSLLFCVCSYIEKKIFIHHSKAFGLNIKIIIKAPSKHPVIKDKQSRNCIFNIKSHPLHPNRVSIIQPSSIRSFLSFYHLNSFFHHPKQPTSNFLSKTLLSLSLLDLVFYHQENKQGSTFNPKFKFIFTHWHI